MYLLYENEKEYRQKYGTIAGVDEAGRGPLAGPLVVASCILSEHSLLSQLNDSKKMSATNREIVYELIIESSVDYTIEIIEPEIIDELNILQATLRGMKNAVEKLKVAPDYVIIDGNRIPDNLPYKSEAIVKGDAKFASIAAASVLAKVARDRIMVELHKEFPLYNFQNNKGYPTKEHIAAIEEHGACKYHRKSFKQVRISLEGGDSTITLKDLFFKNFPKL